MRAGAFRQRIVTAAVVCAAAVSLPASAQAAGTFAWGSNTSGALGVDRPADFPEGAKVLQPAGLGLEGVSAVAAGGRHFALALGPGGIVYSWGQNDIGQLGNGTTTNDPAPTPVPGLGPATSIAAAGSAGFAVMEDGTVKAWGNNLDGQLGQGSNSGPETCVSGTSCSTVPVTVPGLSHVRAIAAGPGTVLALKEDGTVMAWGGNLGGQVGDGTTAEKHAPVQVSGLSEVVAIAETVGAGAVGGDSYAVLADGRVMAWGNGESGRLGNGSTESSSVPVTVSGLSEATQVAAGEGHALALLADGEVWAWGAGFAGQLGTGSKEKSTVPVAVSGITDATAVAAAYLQSFALVAGGQLEAWGEDGTGQLGDGKTERSYLPEPVLCHLTGLEGVSASKETTFAWGPDQETCPSLSAVSPDEGPPAGGTEVTITGTELGSTAEVDFGSTPAASFHVESPTEVKAIAPAGSEGVDVTVTTAHGTSTVTSGDQFFYAALPTVTGVTGYAKPGEHAEIIGTNLGNVTAVHFGSVEMTGFKILSSHVIEGEAPAGVKGIVDVTVTNPTGTSETNPEDRFLIEGAPEFGRCVKAFLPHYGWYADKGCTKEEESSEYEWFPAVLGSAPLEHTGVQLAGTVGIEGQGGVRIKCRLQGTGSVSGYNRIETGGLHLTGCSARKLGTCASGTTAGAVSTEPVSARLGLAEGASVDALQVEPIAGGQLAQMTCGSHSLTVSGSFLTRIGKAAAMTRKFKLKAAQTNGTPELTALQGEPAASLSVSLDGAEAQPAGVKLSVTLTNEEAFEID